MSLASLTATGTKVWLDGVEPDELRRNSAWGITGATSNPTIVSKIIGRGGFDGRIGELIGQGLIDDQIAWVLDDESNYSALAARAYAILTGREQRPSASRHAPAFGIPSHRKPSFEICQAGGKRAHHCVFELRLGPGSVGAGGGDDPLA